MRFVDAALRDARYAARQARRRPGFAIAAIATLGLGIGANTFIFSVAYTVLLRPLPYRDPASLVQLLSTGEDGRTGNVSLADFDDWRTRTTAFARAAVYGTTDVSLSTASGTDAVRAATVSEDFFPLFGVPAAAGRLLSHEDDLTPSAVVSWRVWRDRFGASPGLIGSAVNVNGEATTIVGVAAPRFRFPSDDVDLWMPLGHARASAPPQWKMRGFRAFSAIARLKPGTSPAAAGAELARVGRDLAAEYPRFNKGTGTAVIALRDRIAGPARDIVLLLWAAVGLLLLVACANVANLSLAAASVRRVELAVRSALGATRPRIVTQRLVESAALSAAATAAGVAIAAALRWLLVSFPPEGLPRVSDVTIDLPVLMFAAAAGGVATVTSGTVPALRAAGIGPASLLQDARLASGRGIRRTEAALSVMQIALALVLLVGSLVLARSLASLLSADTGATRRDVVTARLSLTPSAYADPAKQAAFRSTVLAEIGRTPNATAAMISSLPPATAQMRTTITAPATPTAPAHDVPMDIVAVTPEAFTALGLPLASGRSVEERDTAASPAVAVLSVTAARRLFPGIDPIGRQVPFGMGGGGPIVVGVVADVRYHGLDTPADGAMYLPASQRPFRTQYVVVRAAGDAAAAARLIRDAVMRADPAVAVSQVRTFAGLVSDATAQPRFRAMVVGGITAVALLLAAIGLYGLVANLASERVREFGIRLALGATRAQVAALVLRDAAKLGVAGIGLGVAIAYGAQRLAASFVGGLATPDAASVAAAIVFLALLTLAAAGVPAWRATRLAPIDALRRAS